MVAAAVPTHYHAVISSPATFTPTPLEFAVPNLIPLGGITTILAPSGAGRTTLAAMLLAAFVPSLGYKPDSLFTAYFSPLANPHREFRQRLVQLNVPLHTVRFYEHLELTDPHTAAKSRRPFTLEDLPILDSHLEHNPTLRMLVIDSAELFLASSSPRRFQQQLFQLNLLARRRKLAVVLLLPILKLRENPFHNAMLQTLSQASQLTYLLTPPLPASAHKNEAEPDHLAQEPSTNNNEQLTNNQPTLKHQGPSTKHLCHPRLLLPLKTTLPTPIPTRQLLPLPPIPTRLPTTTSVFPTHDTNLTYADYLQFLAPSCLRAFPPNPAPLPSSTTTPAKSSATSSRPAPSPSANPTTPPTPCAKSSPPPASPGAPASPPAAPSKPSKSKPSATKTPGTGASPTPPRTKTKPNPITLPPPPLRACVPPCLRAFLPILITLPIPPLRACVPPCLRAFLPILITLPPPPLRACVPPCLRAFLPNLITLPHPPLRRFVAPSLRRFFPNLITLPPPPLRACVPPCLRAFLPNPITLPWNKQPITTNQ